MLLSNKLYLVSKWQTQDDRQKLSNLAEMEVTVILCTNYKKQTISAEWLNDTSYIHTIWNPV